jgi:hypothetical protein
MDGQRLAAAAQAVVAGESRRQLLGGAVSSRLATGLGWLGFDDAATARLKVGKKCCAGARCKGGRCKCKSGLSTCASACVHPATFQGAPLNRGQCGNICTDAAPCV